MQALCNMKYVEINKDLEIEIELLFQAMVLLHFLGKKIDPLYSIGQLGTIGLHITAIYLCICFCILNFPGLFNRWKVCSPVIFKYDILKEVN